MRVLTAAILALVGAGMAAAHNPPSIHIAATAKGQTLVDGRGMTLYVFDKDTGGKSSCSGACANNWPPVTVDTGFPPHGGWTVVDREDGSKQWAFRGRPLYRFAKDKAPGDVSGDGFLSGAWHVALAQ